MTIKDFCRIAWEESRVSRFDSYVLYHEYKDGIVDIYPVVKTFPRDYDILGINWAEIDLSEELQKIGETLYNKYKNKWQQLTN